ncbi:hypothetical protein PIB30_080600 [Stylosanthes scabra]|uniref:Uncharacterized protein n=1 Tax=Stylosanthes scabra TaxID=79078 RepID=A0ABU6UU44_9FABA|nr:hypothetical protein [Stylosanthes scabra]
MRMANYVVSQTSKHYHVYAVTGFRQGTRVEITSNDEEYVSSDIEYIDSENRLIEVQVVGESEPSSEDERFDDSADDCDHEDHFGFEVDEDEIFDDSADDCDHEDHFGFEVDGLNEQENSFRGIGGTLNEERNNVGAGLGGHEGDQGDAAVDGEAGANGDVGNISSDYDTQSLESYDGGSNEPIKMRRYPRYNAAKMSANYEWRLGLEFG